MTFIHKNNLRTRLIQIKLPKPIIPNLRPYHLFLNHRFLFKKGFRLLTLLEQPLLHEPNLTLPNLRKLFFGKFPSLSFPKPLATVWLHVFLYFLDQHCQLLQDFLRWQFFVLGFCLSFFYFLGYFGQDQLLLVQDC